MPKNKADLKGIIVPIVTPLTDDEELDQVSLEKLINRMIHSGIQGIFIGGSMGEYPNLKDKVKFDLYEQSSDIANGKLLKLANISENSEKKVMENISKIRKLAVDYYVLTAPYYFSYSQNDLKNFFLHIADSSEKPLLVYNIPVFVNHRLSRELIFSLMDHPNIVGLKDSSGEFSQFSRILMEKNSQFVVFQGIPELVYSSFLLKCDGAIPGLGNLIPEKFERLFSSIVEGKTELAKQLQLEINQINQVFDQLGGIIAIKYALSLLNVCLPITTRPFPELTKNQKQIIKETLKNYQIQN